MFAAESMIFLTGDVHHQDRRMTDQRLAPGESEVSVTRRYLEIANSHGVTPTLFFTGLAVQQETTRIEQMMKEHEFEIGGHTYSANRQRWLLAASRRLLHLANGPRWVQKRDMAATIAVMERRLGLRIVSWRNHAYRMDGNTYPLAAELGIGQVSNAVVGPECGMRLIGGVLELSINTFPDHESLGHDSHRRRFATARDWAETVFEQVEYQQSRGLPSVILAHPLCMFVEDQFAAFEKLCAALSKLPTATVREVRRLTGPRGAFGAHWN